MERKRFLDEFEKDPRGWFIVPRAFWPYETAKRGIPGFHRFVVLLDRKLKEERRWSKSEELGILRSLSKEGIIPPKKTVKDYHVYYRNYKNFSEKIGFLVKTPNEEKPIGLTPVGTYFIAAGPRIWPEIFEHQLLKLRFYNPMCGNKYRGFSLYPYLFTLRLLSRLEEKYLTVDEFALRVSLAKRENELKRVTAWAEKYRGLNEKEVKSVRGGLNLNRFYSARMTLLLFALTPGLGFYGKSLVVNDADRIRLLLTKTSRDVPVNYDNVNEWLDYFTNFDNYLWPVVSGVSAKAKRVYRNYISREEGPVHRAIKRHLIENVEKYFGKGATLLEEEYEYETNDRANLVIKGGPHNVLTTVEVETMVRENDLPGLLQAIKYKYMLAVQQRIAFEDVGTYLVAKKVHPSIKKLASEYGVKTIEIDI